MTNVHRRLIVCGIAFAQMMTVVYILHTLSMSYITTIEAPSWSWQRFGVGMTFGVLAFANNLLVWRAMKACLALYPRH